MTIITPASIKSNFQTGDKPTQAQFGDFIDTAVPDWQSAITTLVQAGGTGMLEIEASASATTRAVGAVGATILQAATTASITSLFGAGAAGLEILSAESTASARGVIGAVGITGDETIAGVKKYSGSQLWQKGADIASASTLTLGTDGNFFDVTGTTTITSIATIGGGGPIKLQFDSTPTMNYHSTDLILEGQGNYTFGAGDTIEMFEYATGKWIQTGGSPQTASTSVVAAASNNQLLVTPGRMSSHPGVGATTATAIATTSGTAHAFGSIPTGTYKIEIMFAGVSLSGTDHFLIQIGPAGGIVTTGYVSSGGSVVDSTNSAVTSSTAGFIVRSGVAASVHSGLITLTNITGDTWVSSHSTKENTSRVGVGGGNITLADVLTQLSITTTGSNTFDAGSVNIRYYRDV